MNKYYILLASLGIGAPILTKPVKAQELLHLMHQCTTAQAQVQKLITPLQKNLKKLSLPALQTYLAGIQNPWKNYAALYAKAHKNTKALQKKAGRHFAALTKQHAFLQQIRITSQKKVERLQREHDLAVARLHTQQLTITLNKLQQILQKANPAYRAQAQKLLATAQTQQQQLTAALPKALKTRNIKARRQLAQQVTHLATLLQQQKAALASQQALNEQTQGAQRIQVHTAPLTQLLKDLTATNQEVQKELRILSTTSDEQLYTQSHKVAALLRQAQNTLKNIQALKGDSKNMQTTLAPLLALHTTQQEQFNKHQEEHLQECPLCLNDIAPSKIHTLTCGHTYCSDCVQRQVNTYLEERNPLVCKLYTASNPHTLCNTPFSYQELAVAFDQETLQRIEERASEQEMMRNPHYKHCPTPGCTYGYLYENTQPRTISCPTCKHSHCTQCFKDHPQTISCTAFGQRSINDKLFDQWKAKKHVRPCPQCKAPIEKSAGCRAMTCAKCKYKFCWTCMGPAHGHLGVCRRAQN